MKKKKKTWYNEISGDGHWPGKFTLNRLDGQSLGSGSNNKGQQKFSRRSVV